MSFCSSTATSAFLSVPGQCRRVVESLFATFLAFYWLANTVHAAYVKRVVSLVLKDLAAVLADELKLEARSVRESPRTVIVAIYRRKCREFLSVVDFVTDRRTDARLKT